MRYFYSLLFVFISFISKADAWDPMTQEEAEAVKERIEKDPFIFDYCDCCSDAPVYLLKVLSAEITTCDWDNAYMSVKIKAKRLAKFEFSLDVNMAGFIPLEEGEIVEDYTIYMNYTSIFDDATKLAQPIVNLMSYHYEHNITCNGKAIYPKPSAAGIKDKDYKKWYKKRVK